MISWERCRPLACDVMASRGVCVPCPGGSFRSDAIHPAGPFTLGDLVAILPFMDVIVVIECTGAQILEGLENGALLCLENGALLCRHLGAFGRAPNAPIRRLSLLAVTTQSSFM